MVSVTGARLSSSDESEESEEDEDEEELLLLMFKPRRLAEETCDRMKKNVLYLDDEELELLVLESESLSLRIAKLTKTCR